MTTDTSRDEGPPTAIDRTRARSAELFAQMRGADDPSPAREAARDGLVHLHLPLVEHCARRFRNRGEPLEDLVQVGTIGLIKAVDRFDTDRGVEFSTYATPTIIGEIKRYFRDHAWDVRPPRRLQELRPRLRSEEERLTQELGSRPGARELAAALGCDESEVRELAVADLGVEYLDRPAADGTSDEPMHQLPTADRGFEQVEASATIGPAFRRLSDQDRRILALRFVEEYTQQQIADELGVSQMQVSRLLRRILNELRAAIGELDERRDREFARPVPAKSA